MVQGVFTVFLGMFFFSSYSEWVAIMPTYQTTNTFRVNHPLCIKKTILVVQYGPGCLYSVSTAILFPLILIKYKPSDQSGLTICCG